MVTLMLDEASGITRFQCRQILGGRYPPLAPLFPAGTTCAMDDVEH